MIVRRDSERPNAYASPAGLRLREDQAPAGPVVAVQYTGISIFICLFIDSRIKYVKASFIKE